MLIFTSGRVIVEKPRQIVRMELDIELLVDEVLNLLFLLGFALFEQVQETFSLFLVELRGPAAPEVRCQKSEPTLIPESGPATAG